MGFVDVRKKQLFLNPEKITITEDNGEVKELYCFVGQHGYIYQKEEFIEVLEKAMEFYNRPDAEELIEKQNDDQFFWWGMQHAIHYLNCEETNDGKYTFPKPDFKKKKFTQTRNWSVKCNWCGKKVSNTEQEHYFTLNNTELGLSMERACTDVCATHIWNESASNWIFARGYEKYFVMDKGES
ncbi:hypothetical protein [Neobacillus cucumis]|uniref:hypothetical protein n=1 Tax=Neobacillus cucumis TaxID=1740721 RepID=UPI002E20CFE8|nr:hypothetical protein [Neobacillus cucumis]